MTAIAHRNGNRARLCCLVTIGVTTAALAGPIELVDATAAAGLESYLYFTVDPSPHPAGVGFVDVTGDDLPDLYLLQGEGLRNRLAVNRGDGTFEDVTEPSGTGSRAFTVAVRAADYDGDGDVDLYLGNVGPNVLYRNDGDGTFTDVATEAGVLGPATAETYSPAWLDCDADGHLDLYLGNWGTAWREDVLYRNRGDGSFEDVTAESGIDNPGFVLAIGVLDYDGDRRPDLYVSNDLGDDVLYRNLGDCRFEDVTASAGVGDDAGQAMGVAIGDYDNDGHLDVYVTDTLDNPVDRFDGTPLYRNRGDGTFVNVSEAAGTTGVFSWGAVFADLDRDGWQDLYVAAHAADTPLPDAVYSNRGDGTFANLGWRPSLRNTGNARGVAVADLERDGDLDLFVVNTPHAPEIGGELVRFPRRSVLWRNESSESNWLGFDLIGTASNRSAIGARVELRAPDGRLQLRELAGAMSYASSSSSTLHFGLGSLPEADAVVRWPSGATSELGTVPSDQYLRVTEDEPIAMLVGPRPGRVDRPPAAHVELRGPRRGAVDLHVELRHEGRAIAAFRAELGPAERRWVSPVPEVPTRPGRGRWVAELRRDGRVLSRSEWRFRFEVPPRAP